MRVCVCVIGNNLREYKWSLLIARVLQARQHGSCHAAIVGESDRCQSWGENVDDLLCKSAGMNWLRPHINVISSHDLYLF